MSQDLLFGLQQLQHRRPLYDTYRAYEAGQQPIMFATEKFRTFYENVMRRYRLNICRSVVRQTSRRLAIQGWDGDDDAAGWWQTEGLRLQNRLFREGVRQGDAYTLTWPVGTVNGPLRDNRLRADEAIVIYSDEDPDQPEYALKTWLVRAGDPKSNQWDLRANVYYPDRAERFISRNAATSHDGNPARVDLDKLQPTPMDDEVGPEVRYQGLLAQAGTQGLLPLQHFAVQPDDTPYGTSVLADVIPVQDGLNKHAIDILVTSEQYGLPLRGALGIEEHVEVNPETGEQTSNLDIDYDPRIDVFLGLPGEHSKLVQLPAAEMQQLLEVKRACIQDATIASNVPLTLLAEDSGNIPTGVALRETKAPLAELVEDIQQDLTVSARNLAALHGWDAAPVWAAPFQMDPVEVWELVQQKIDAGWPARQAYIEAGLEPDMVDEVFAENADVERSVADALVRAEREGRDPSELLR